MKTVETKLPVGEIVDIKKLDDGTWIISQKVEKISILTGKAISEDVLPNEVFRLIEAESLSLKDEFMQYEPKTESEKNTKALIMEAIDKKVKNFYRPKYDPSFIDEGNEIQFVAGKKPAGGKSYNWWFDAAKNYCSSRKSRLGTRLEYGAFLGILIKKLVEAGISSEMAWDAVCNDSKELGHYRNSENAKLGYEPTGSRCICGFYDLANTCKFVANDVEIGGFWLAGGACGDLSSGAPISVFVHEDFCDCDYSFSVGWIVLSE